MKRLISCSGAIIGLISGSVPAYAQTITDPTTATADSTTADADAAVVVPSADTATVAPSTAQEDPNALDDTALDGQRGGEAIVIGNQQLSAIMQGSVLNGDYSAGTISLSDNALSNFTGIGNVLINSGALNNLQSGMNVTINISN